jgi:hypothetical protein
MPIATRLPERERVVFQLACRCCYQRWVNGEVALIFLSPRKILRHRYVEVAQQPAQLFIEFGANLGNRRVGEARKRGTRLLDNEAVRTITLCVNAAVRRASRRIMAEHSFRDRVIAH